MFPKNFFWGGATSAAQYEGAFDQGGRGTSHLDFINCIPPGEYEGSLNQLSYETYSKYQNEPDKYNLAFRRGSDFYHRYKEDIALMGEMGFKMFRMSISWPRLFPTGLEEKPLKDGVEFYHNVFRELKKYGIEPLVTMTHYEIPSYLTDTYNGWEDPRLIDLFVRYSTFIADEYAGEVKYWLTFNEINQIISEPFLGGGLFVEKTKKQNIQSCIHQSLHHEFIASAKTVKYIHDHHPECLVGDMVCRVESYPETCKPEDVLANYRSVEFNNIFHDVQVKGEYPFFMDRFYRENDISIVFVEDYDRILKEGTVDFITFSYYDSSVVTADPDRQSVLGDFRLQQNPYIVANRFGSQSDPTGLRIALNELYDRYHKPILVSENGYSTDEVFAEGTVHDSYRIEYLRDHINAIGSAINDGVDVIGYTMWGCIDVVSCHDVQMEKRYGFVYVDADNYGNGSYDRYRKDSFYWYKKVIASNGEDLA